MVLAPHADDELIGCHYFMKSHPNLVCFCFCFTGTNNDLDNYVQRKNEFVDYCSNNKINYIFPEGNWKEALFNLLMQNRFDYILLPSIIDWHQEHRKVNYLLSELNYHFQNKPGIIWYQISVPICKKYINYVERSSKEGFCNKWKNFDCCYISQKKINKKRFMYCEQNREYDTYSAESYTVLNFEDWIRLVEYSKSVDNEFFNMKKRLNNLLVLMNMSNRFYHKTFKTLTNKNC